MRATRCFPHARCPPGHRLADGDISPVFGIAVAEHARQPGEYPPGRMREMMQRHPLIRDARSLGLGAEIELVKSRRVMGRAADEAEEVRCQVLSDRLNFKLTRENILTLTPGLTITKEGLDEALGIIEIAISEVESSRR